MEQLQIQMNMVILINKKIMNQITQIIIILIIQHLNNHILMEEYMEINKHLKITIDPIHLAITINMLINIIILIKILNMAINLMVIQIIVMLNFLTIQIKLIFKYVINLFLI